jgi:deoxyadenosine/deoxycytidine kinase
MSFKNGYQKGYLSNLEWNLYLNWFDFLIKNHCKEPHGFIYLKVDPDIAYKRIKKRNRISEKEISLSYIKNLHVCHEEFLIEKKDILPELKKVPVLTIDCNEDFEKNTKKFLAHAILVEEFIIKNNRDN